MRLDFNHEPERFELIEQIGEQYSVNLRENIYQAVGTDEGELWYADVYVGRIPADTEDKEGYIEEHFDELLLQAKAKEKANEVRIMRDSLLSQTDKFMMLDRMNLGSASTFVTFLAKLKDILSGDIARYRQALRDVPEQDGFPWNVKWPDMPESIR